MATFYNLFFRNSDLVREAALHNFSLYSSPVAAHSEAINPRSHISKMYSEMAGSRIIKSEYTGPTYSTSKRFKDVGQVTDVPLFDSVALKSKNGKTVVFVVSRNVSASQNVNINIPGSRFSHVLVKTLHSSTPWKVLKWGDNQVFETSTKSLQMNGDKVRINIPNMAIVRLEFLEDTGNHCQESTGSFGACQVASFACDSNLAKDVQDVKRSSGSFDYEVISQYMIKMGRLPDWAGYAYWKDQGGGSKGLRDFLNSSGTGSRSSVTSFYGQDVFERLTENQLRTFVSNIYLKNLGTLPDQEGLDHWTGPKYRARTQKINIIDDILGNFSLDQCNTSSEPIRITTTIRALAYLNARRLAVYVLNKDRKDPTILSGRFDLLERGYRGIVTDTVLAIKNKTSSQQMISEANKKMEEYKDIVDDIFAAK